MGMDLAKDITTVAATVEAMETITSKVGKADKGSKVGWEAKEDSEDKGSKAGWEAKEDSEDKGSKEEWEAKVDSADKGSKAGWEAKVDTNTENMILSPLYEFISYCIKSVIIVTLFDNIAYFASHHCQLMLH
jgi:hypothetical protein